MKEELFRGLCIIDSMFVRILNIVVTFHLYHARCIAGATKVQTLRSSNESSRNCKDWPEAPQNKMKGLTMQY